MDVSDPNPRYDSASAGGWCRRWAQECGIRDVLQIALPLILSTMSWSIMNFMDRMMLFWHDADAMAASMPAAMLSFTMFCLPLGIASYTNTFVAQYYGAGSRLRIGRVVWQAIWLGVAVVPLMLLLVPAAPTIFRLAGHSANVARLESMYFQTLMWGAGAAVLESALSSFFTGRGATRVVLYVSVLGAGLNGWLDYLWIFGNLGFASAGILGAGWATVCSIWLKVVAYGVLIFWARGQGYGFGAGCVVDGMLLRRLFRFGIPNGLQMFLEVASFTYVLFLVGRLGDRELTATTLAFNVNSIAFVPMIGMGIAVTTLVGQQLGRNRPDLAERATWNAFLMAMAYSGAMATLYVGFPDLFLMGHGAFAEGQSFEQVRAITVILLRFVAAYCLLDAANVIFVSAIKGAGDTHFVLCVSLVMCCVMPLLGYLGLSYFGWGIFDFWGMFTAWITALGLIYLARFRHGRWREMRVIERHWRQPSEPTVDTPEREQDPFTLSDAAEPDVGVVPRRIDRSSAS